MPTTSLGQPTSSTSAASKCSTEKRLLASPAWTMGRSKSAAAMLPLEKSLARSPVRRRPSLAFRRIPSEPSYPANLIISPGGTPKLPPALSIHWPHPRIFHSSSYISSAEAFFSSLPQSSEPLRIAVIGAGQSATEVLLDLHSRLNSIALPAGKKHVLDMIFRKGSLKPSDDSPFSNEIFDPACELPCMYSHCIRALTYVHSHRLHVWTAYSA